MGKTKTKGSATERGLEAHLSADGEEPCAIDVAIAGDVVATLDEGAEVIRKPNVEAEDESGDESAFFFAGVVYVESSSKRAASLNESEGRETSVWR